MASQQPMSARLAGKRTLQAVLLVVMVAALGSLVLYPQPVMTTQLGAFIVGCVGFIAASYIHAKS